MRDSRLALGSSDQPNAPRNAVRADLSDLVASAGLLAAKLDQIEMAIRPPTPRPVDGRGMPATADHPTIEASIDDLRANLDAAHARAEAILSRL